LGPGRDSAPHWLESPQGTEWISGIDTVDIPLYVSGSVSLRREMSEFLVISCSLNPDSRSRILCQAAYDLLKGSVGAEFIDLRDMALPMCDGASAYGHPSVAPLAEKIRAAKCVLVGVPVYNYYANAAAKNMVELTGRAWTDKVVGFLCAAGGRSSYMSVMSFANSLMLDFRCLVIPRFVYADGNGFADGKISDSEVTKRINELVETATKLTTVLNSA
jgi:NAD(P)H-dependent FMN reductase